VEEVSVKALTKQLRVDVWRDEEGQRYVYVCGPDDMFIILKPKEVRALLRRLKKKGWKV
jgi:hypothetical protein